MADTYRTFTPTPFNEPWNSNPGVTRQPRPIRRSQLVDNLLKFREADVHEIVLADRL